MRMPFANRIRRNPMYTSGFTLVELMVSLTIFSIVILVCGSTLLILVDVNAKAQALYSSTTNLSFALDSITREIRTGSRYYCDDSIADTASLPNGTRDGEDCGFIAFSRGKDNKRVGYRVNSDSVIEQKIESGNWTPMTSKDVLIETFAFNVRHSDPYYDATDITNSPFDTRQPTIDILIRGSVTNGLKESTDFNIQSRMVSRPSNAF